MMAIASLPMYDMPSTRTAFDAFWSGLAANLRRRGLKHVPDQLTHGRDSRDLWADPDLLISQCCGFDVVAGYKGKLRPVATPWYTAVGCANGNYSSKIVVHVDSPYHDVREMKGLRAAINGPESHSGMSALRHLISQHHGGGIFFDKVIVSGSHRQSLSLIRSHAVDVAAIDCVTLSLIRRGDPQSLRNVRILGTTYGAPAPPFVVRHSMPDNDVAAVKLALLDTFADPALAACRQQLLLGSVNIASLDDYWVLEAFRDHALKRGFSMVH